MGRSPLHDMLPDLAAGKPAGSPKRAPPGFEPLVQRALTRDEFTSIDMPVGFTGLTPDFDAPDLMDGLDDSFGANAEDDLFVETIAVNPLAELDLAGDADPFADPLEAFGDGAEEIVLSEPDGILEDTAASDEEVMLEPHLEASHRQEIEDLQAEHRQALDGLVSSAIPKMKEEIIEQISGELAKVLAGRIRTQIVSATLDALSAELAELMNESSVTNFEIRGPESLISDFQERIATEGMQIKAVPSDRVDLVVRVDGTAFATRLGEFDRLLEEAMA